MVQNCQSRLSSIVPSRGNFCTIIIIFVLINMIGAVSRSCPASLKTKEYVSSCPMNKMDWDNAAREKNCSGVEQDCTAHANFQYHCLANSFQSKLIEICAIPVDITFPVCAEYNEGGNIVQENHFTDCSGYSPPCPSRYPSTEAYKYVECYNVTQQTTTVTVLASTSKQIPSTTAVSATSDKKADNTTNSDTVKEASTEMPHLKYGQLYLSLVVAAGITIPVFSILLIASCGKRKRDTGRSDIHKHSEKGSPEETTEMVP